MLPFLARESFQNQERDEGAIDQRVYRSLKVWLFTPIAITFISSTYARPTQTNVSVTGVLDLHSGDAKDVSDHQKNQRKCTL